MKSLFRRLATLLSAAAFVRRHEVREMREMEAYLATAQSLPELEHLQRSWDRQQRASNFSPWLAFSR